LKGWSEFKRKHGLHELVDPACYANGVFQALLSFIPESGDACRNLPEVIERLQHLKSLQNVLLKNGKVLRIEVLDLRGLCSH